MGAGEGEQEQWSGGVHVVLECEVERAWALMADFTGLHNWNPMVKVCRLVEGVNRQPGCVRYCEGTRSESWVYERLLFIDEARHEMSYRMEKNRFRFQDGIRGYVARIQMHNAGHGKTAVDWTYTVDPVATQTRAELTSFMTTFYSYNLSILQSAANASTIAYQESTGQQQRERQISVNAAGNKPLTAML